MRPYKDLTNQRFHLLTVTKKVHQPNKHKTKNRNAYWEVLCDCGTKKIVRMNELTTGATKSCGCLRKSRLKTHGQSKTRLYNIYHKMMARCYNHKMANYPRYGGRKPNPVKVYKPWHKFEAFYKYIVDNLGLESSSAYQIDRINNNKGYYPGNLRWASPREQSNNTRRNFMITAFGITLTCAQWSRKLGICQYQLRQRIRRYNFTPEEAIQKALN